MIFPKPLFKGARVALVAPAYAVTEESFTPAINLVKSLGLEPIIYPSCLLENSHGYFSANDNIRAKDIQDAFSDDSIDGIWCIRGGYGTHRILPLLDFDKIKPKFFAGYSDITALHTALNQICNFATFHTTMPSTEYENLDEYTLEYLKTSLFTGDFTDFKNPVNIPMSTLYGGKCEGVLCGGNLALVASSLGTPYEIDTKDKILFLEDIGEYTYRIDGQLTQLRNSGKLEQCAGILLGAYTDCNPQDPENNLDLEEIFKELIAPLKKPTIYNVQCGHILPTMALPLGYTLSMNADTKNISVVKG